MERVACWEMRNVRVFETAVSDTRRIAPFERRDDQLVGRIASKGDLRVDCVSLDYVVEERLWRKTLRGPEQSGIDRGSP